MRKLVLCLGIAMGTLSAHADPVAVTLLGFNGGLWQWGYPYYAYVQGVGAVDVMCDDYEHGGSPGNLWLANQTNLGTGNLSLLRFNNLPGALTLYDEAGWLLLETQTTPHSAWRDMNIAVWHILDPEAPLTPFASWWLMEAQNEAEGGFQGVDFSHIEILTPLDQHSSDPNGMQELMYLTSSNGQPAAVPEPGTLLLLSTTLVVASRRVGAEKRLGELRYKQQRNCTALRPVKVPRVHEGLHRMKCENRMKFS